MALMGLFSATQRRPLRHESQLGDHRRNRRLGALAGLVVSGAARASGMAFRPPMSSGGRAFIRPRRNNRARAHGRANRPISVGWRSRSGGLPGGSNSSNMTSVMPTGASISSSKTSISVCERSSKTAAPILIWCKGRRRQGRNHSRPIRQKIPMSAAKPSKR